MKKKKIVKHMYSVLSDVGFDVEESVESIEDLVGFNFMIDDGSVYYEHPSLEDSDSRMSIDSKSDLSNLLILVINQLLSNTSDVLAISTFGTSLMARLYTEWYNPEDENIILFTPFTLVVESPDMNRIYVMVPKRKKLLIVMYEEILNTNNLVFSTSYKNKQLEEDLNDSIIKEILEYSSEDSSDEQN